MSHLIFWRCEDVDEEIRLLELLDGDALADNVCLVFCSPLSVHHITLASLMGSSLQSICVYAR